MFATRLLRLRRSRPFAKLSKPHDLNQMGDAQEGMHDPSS